MSCQVGLSLYHSATLPQHVPSPELPENDIRLLSYYLNCCIVGCEVPVDVPSELLDYRRVPQLPQECQDAIYRVAIHVFQPENVLNKIIFLDDHCTILPLHTPNMFLSTQRAAEMASFVPSFGPIASTSGKIMVCTSEWLNIYYLAPMARYLYQGAPHQHMNLRAEDPSRATSEPRRERQKVEKERHEVHNVHIEVGGDDEEIPMAEAVPIDAPPQSQAQDELFVSIFLPGQLVKLSGLIYSSMNEEVAIVLDRCRDRLIVIIPGDPRRYSVKPENLVILDGHIDPEDLPDL